MKTSTGMNNQMSEKEYQAFKKLCTKNGKMMVIAMDQRNSMRVLLSDDEQVVNSVDNKELGKVKARLVQYLGNYAPAVLLDPECAFPEIIDDKVLAEDVALVVGLDASGYDVDPLTMLRESRIVQGVDASTVKKLGGTAAKLLVFMRPDQVEDHTYTSELINKTVKEFSDQDVLLVVEILVYKLQDENLAEFEQKKPDLINEAACLAVENGAKVLKLQYPGSAEMCRKVSETVGDVPWAVLSQGVSHEVFIDQLKVAMKNGASGAIAGRSLWKDCVSLLPVEMKERLETLALPRLREILALLNEG
ncbi:MAG TPA: tagatose-bisphosphate aldolase [Anaerolineaceae bacterium]|nr:tagatose-bisphosphate aldolase [Anaerolineaceae bacterium]